MANTKKYVSLDKLGLYDEKIKGVISAGDTAALDAAKAYADSLAVNYDAAGAAATAEANAKAYADGLNNDLSAFASQVNQLAGQAENHAQTALRDASKAQAAADSAKEDIIDLKNYVGTIPSTATATNVVDYIDAKTSGIASEGAMTELANRVGVVEGDVATIKGDYLKAADKTELEGKINAKADQTALDGVSEVANAAVKKADYDVKVAALEAEDARIAGLVATEAADRAAADEAIDARLEKVEAFFVGAAEDEGEGENLKNALDTLKEIQDFATGEGTAAAEMLESIAANAKAIEDEAKARAEADEALGGRLDVLEAIDHEAYVAADTALEGKLNGEIAKKADASALTQALEAQAQKDSAQDGKIAALEAKFDGEGSVSALIATAKQEAINAAAADAASKDEVVLAAAKKYADDEDAKVEERVAALETASATHALASDLTTLAGRVTTAEGEIDTLQSEMDAVEALAAANKAAHEANAQAIALKADASALNAVSDRVTTLETWHNNFTEVSEEEINNLFA